MKTYKNLASVIRSVVTESSHKKDDPPFEPDEKSSFKKANNKNRTGMDAAGALARRAMQKAMQKKMKESFDLNITDEEADDLLNSIQEEQSDWVKEYGFTADDHEKAAAEHLKAAKAHEKSGNMPEHYASMINHYTSKAKALGKRTPLRGTFPAGSTYGDG